MTTVAFVTPWPVNDPRAWSGVIQPMIHALKAYVDVVPVSTAAVENALIDRALARLTDGRFGKRYLVGHALATSMKRGRELTKRLQLIRPDAVLAVAASQDVAFLGGTWPVVQVSDLTFQAARELYTDFQNLHAFSWQQGTLVSRRSVARTAGTLAATEWVRERLVTDDGLRGDLIRVAPFGPGIEPLEPKRVTRAAGSPRLLAVISNWHRKGGDRVVAIHEELLRRGFSHELTVAGSDAELPATIRSVGRVPMADMAKLYQTSDLLLEPARGNASGITLTDAANFGLPAVATNTGGVSTIVRDGVTGILLDATDEPAIVREAADAVEQIVPVLDTYGTATKRYADQSLTWKAWASAASAVLSEVVASR